MTFEEWAKLEKPEFSKYSFEHNMCKSAYNAGRKAGLKQAEAENKRLKEKYEDLIMQVVCKFQGETRHDTAKRYIQERENREVPEAQQALQGERDRD